MNALCLAGLINTYISCSGESGESGFCYNRGAFWLAALDKEFTSKVCVCVLEKESEEEQETPAHCTKLYAIMLKHMDRQVLCHYCKGTFDMV